MPTVRGIREMAVQQLIEVGQEVWRGITMNELRERIKDMPERCNIPRNNGGKHIKVSKR